MNWEIDVFGSIRNRVKAQKENFAASKEDYNAVMVSLCAQVASAYINLRELQQEVEVVKKNCLSQQAVVKITEKDTRQGLSRNWMSHRPYPSTTTQKPPSPCWKPGSSSTQTLWAY